MNTSPEQLLMQKIHKRWHTLIAETVRMSSVPPAFLAALIANESAGNPEAQRFEPAVFTRISEVLLGKRSIYEPAGIHHPLGINEFLPFVDPPSIGGPAIPGGFRGSLKRVAELSTSHSLTQIMGWHALEFSKPFSDLVSPVPHLRFAVFLLTYFAQRYDLDLSSGFEGLFRCWNTGRPDKKTFDPEYVPAGKRRIAIYTEIAAAAPAPEAVT